MTLQAKIDQTVALLKQIEADFSPATFANSFGAEDMVLTDLIAKHAPRIEVFTLDTGRLPAETYDLMQKVIDQYKNITLKPYFPESKTVEAYIAQHGPNGFYQSVDLRKACCNMRKIEPLKRALAGKKSWITGLRREQSVTRTEMQAREWDAGFGLEKFNPLIEWTNAEVWDYIKVNHVPYNALHDQHYPSIGCAPCTRAIAVGEDIRAGRWWWENPETKECGLHAKK